MVEQVRIFATNTTSDDWKNRVIDNQINQFLAKKREDGAKKEITRVFHVYNADQAWLLITIFYQWMKDPPNMGPYRTPSEGE